MSRAKRFGVRTVALAMTSLVASSAFGVVINENSSHQMTMGDFAANGKPMVAYIQTVDTPGQIFLNDQSVAGFSRVVPGVTAKQVIAANIDGVGGDELVFLDGVTGFLKSYSFATNTVTTLKSINFQDVTAGQIDFDAQIELLTSRTVGTAMEFFDAVTNITTSAAGGTAGNNVSANFNNNGLTDFAVRNGANSGSGALHTLLDPYAGFTGLGGGLNRIATGNLDGNSDPADEVYLTNSAGNLFVHRIDTGGYTQSNGTGTDPTIGHLADGVNGDNRDLAYIIGIDSRIYQGTTNWVLTSFVSMGYTLLRTDAANNGSALATGNTFDFFDLFTADMDFDGLDELYARKTSDGGQNLFVFRNGTAGFVLAAPVVLPEPASISLLVLSGLMLGRRRRTA